MGLPENPLQIVSTLDLPRGFQVDTRVCYVDDIERCNVDCCFRLDLRLGWQATGWLEIQVSA